MSFGRGEQALQLRLAAEHDLQQLAVVGVDVRDHAQLLERLGAEVLRFVDDQDRAAPGIELLVEEVLELLVEADIGAALELLVEGHQDPFEQLAAATLDVGQQPDIDITGELAEQMLDQRGLAGADFAGDDGEAGVVDDAVFEHGEGQAVRTSPIEKPGVGDDREGSAVQPVKRFATCSHHP